MINLTVKKQTVAALPDLTNALVNDTRNGILTIARIWQTLTTKRICSKSEAAAWALSQLLKPFHPVLQRAQNIYLGKKEEFWHDLESIIKPTAKFMINTINSKLDVISKSRDNNKTITIKFKKPI